MRREEDPVFQGDRNYCCLIATAVIKYSAYYKKVDTTFMEALYYSVSLCFTLSLLSETANKPRLNIDGSFQWFSCFLRAFDQRSYALFPLLWNPAFPKELQEEILYLKSTSQSYMESKHVWRPCWPFMHSLFYRFAVKHPVPMTDVRVCVCILDLKSRWCLQKQWGAVALSALYGSSPFQSGAFNQRHTPRARTLPAIAEQSPHSRVTQRHSTRASIWHDMTGMLFPRQSHKQRLINFSRTHAAMMKVSQNPHIQLSNGWPLFDEALHMQ